MNTDLVSQVTSADWIFTSTEVDVKTSMNARSRYLDNMFTERLWGFPKQKAIYLHELQDGFQAKRIINVWISLHNTEQTHSALDKRPPEVISYNTERFQKAA
jgi:putative transposase